MSKKATNSEEETTCDDSLNVGFDDCFTDVSSTDKSWFKGQSLTLLHTCYSKVHIVWEGPKILRNLHLTFDWLYIGQK